jgi:thiamine-monophosphate kinase
MLIENEYFTRIRSSFAQADFQVNQLLESDAELIRITDTQVLAITTDQIVEEIEAGIYTDPYQMGWMSVIANLSDLAAVGAEALVFLSNLQVPKDLSTEFLETITRGINDACLEYNCFVAGGDTNFSKNLQLGGTALGVINDNKCIMRKGNQPGDRLYMSGPMGLGSAFAFEKLMKNQEPEYSFLPKAKISEGIVIRKYGSSCIDTSDGFFHAISNLMYINRNGIWLKGELEDLLMEKFKDTMINSDLPSWILLAGPHGEFELLFTVNSRYEDRFLKEAHRLAWFPIKIGEIINDPVFSFYHKGISYTCDPDGISNLYEKCGDNLTSFIKLLLENQQSWKQL